MAEIKYDIRRGADIYRAIYGSRLKTWISAGKIKPGEVSVWRSGLSGWRRPEELEELTVFFEQWEKRQAKQARRQRFLRQLLPHKRHIKDILIIDDEKDLCSLLYDVLTPRGYNVEIANTKRAGMAWVKEKKPDLVFLDLKLPDGDGMSILSKIKKINSKTIVNIISAYGSEESREEAKNKGVYSFLDKPFTEKEILKSVRAR